MVDVEYSKVIYIGKIYSDVTPNVNTSIKLNFFKDIVLKLGMKILLHMADTNVPPTVLSNLPIFQKKYDHYYF